MNYLSRVLEVQYQSQNPFRYAGNDLNTLSQSDDLQTRQAVADQNSAPQEDFGSLLAVLER